MPASEQTWRSPKLMHTVFAVSGVGLLLCTIWMFAADHDRSWKDHQRQFRNVELTSLDWRKQQEANDDAMAKQARAQDRLDELRSSPLNAQTLEEFWAEVRARGNSYEQDHEDGFQEFLAAHEELITAARQAREAYSEERLRVDQLRVGAEDARKAADARQKGGTDPDAKQKQALLSDLEEKLANAEQGAEESRATLKSAEQAATESRKEVVDALKAVIQLARVDEDRTLQDRKFASADFDAVRAELGIGVRDGKSPSDLDEIQQRVDTEAANVQELLMQYQGFSQHRKQLQRTVDKLIQEEQELVKDLEDARAALVQLDKAVVDRRSTFFVSSPPFLGKRWLELPILDAFNSPLKIQNLWSEGLDQKYGSFNRVRRFDRCTTCHQAIQSTAPGSAVDPAWVHNTPLELVLSPPNADERAQADTGDPTLDQRLERLYGVSLADGLLDPSDVTVRLVRRESSAARAAIGVPEDLRSQQPGIEIRMALLQPAPDTAHADVDAGLRVGDVIIEINGSPMRDRQRTVQRLLEAADSNEVLTLTVRRGLAHPYASHPRLDLFVGSLSPHRMEEFACTVCHDGQGSATDFKWASHTPDSDRQRLDWREKYGWFDNHHWIFPMNPKRFVEASCLKCHHDVHSLAASQRFPDPPAPKLTRGHQLILKYGCYGCHEVNGFDGPDKRLGPDLRLEPNFYAAALQFQHAPDTGYDRLTPEEQELVGRLITHPEEQDVRRRVHSLILEDARVAEQSRAGKSEKEPRLTAYVHDRLEPLLRDVEVPGKLTKVGPSLRFVARKLDPAFMFDWIREPKHFRPGTRMPQFFGLWDHLPAESTRSEIAALQEQKARLARVPKRRRNTARIREIEEQIADLQTRAAQAEAGQVEKGFEPLEVFGMVTYLTQRSQDFAYLDPTALDPQDASSTDQRVARGKLLFEERGCLACHTHKDFPESKEFRKADDIVQGPDLSGLGDKFASIESRRWLYSWIKNPTRYHARTVMPDLFLAPLEHKNAQGQVTHRSDPVADIAAYLTSDRTGWRPKGDTIAAANQVDSRELKELALEFLKDAFYTKRAEQYLEVGIPERLRAELKGAETELVVPNESFEAGTPLSQQQILLYVGNKTISKYGCYACHDIPGFEDAKPIGTGLADWGRKEPAKLAFEHITHYLHGPGGGHSHGAHSHGGHSSSSTATPDAGHADASREHGDDGAAGDGAAAEAAREPIDEYFLHAIESSHREGFIYQKLREPRSFDYHVTENKRYSERLRMPQFPFGHDEREAIITFVIGLVADPPSAKYVYKPDPRSEALIAGRAVLEKYNCGGCHVLEPERWSVSLPDGAVPAPPAVPTYPFLAADYSSDELAESGQTDARGRLEMHLAGMPALNPADGRPLVNETEEDQLTDEDTFDPTSVLYNFELWKPTPIDGHAFGVGQVVAGITDGSIEKRHSAEGGTLARYLLAPLLQRQKQGNELLSRLPNPNASGKEVWGFVPPPLIGEGKKVQSGWLYEFLIDPYPIRPQVVLRMPKFNLAASEATALVNYFAALDEAEYPYNFDARRRSSHLAEAESRYQEVLQGASASGTRFGDAMKILTDSKNGCTQCHQIGDFAQAPKGPDLAAVHRRLRPEYVRNWLARPAAILPYTTMPENFKYRPDAPAEDGFVVKQGMQSVKYVHGTSTEQVDATVDLLMNWDEYMKQQTSISRLVEENSPKTPATPDSTAAAAGAAP